jgi:hypothetical protein
MLDDTRVTDEPDVVELPAPRSAASHVAQATEVLPRPHEAVSEAGVPHPAHRARQ